ncbi:hypothetical protein [Chitinophaga sp. MM2321]|uniref:hypothetical protein n=1 Tax=Chitinophaga sp. MM2321 TaxID=3137178 RepID=UPI0032D57C95
MSSPRIWHLLNNLVQGAYLEIGTWKGSTLIAALYGKQIRATAIDDFSQFGGPHKEFLANTANLTFAFLNGDCFNTLQIEAVGEGNEYYFYDGGHTEQDQYNALVMYIGKMAGEFVYIVDDWNHEPARTGTRKAIADLQLHVIEEHELFTPGNGHRETWWNGIAIFRLRK